MKIVASSLFALFLALCGVQPATAADPLATLVIAEDWPTLETVANERLKGDPADSAALHALGRLAIDGEVGSEELRRSLLPRLEACVAAKPTDALCQLGYGQVLGVELTSASRLSALASVGKVQDAFEAAVAADPESYEARESLVTFYLQAPAIVGGSLTKARQHVEAYAAVDETRARLLHVLIALQNGEPAKASADLAILPAKDLAGDLPRLYAKRWLAVGMTRLEAKQYAAAKTAFDLSLAGAPSVVGDAHWGLGQIALAAGRPDEAIDEFTRALRTVRKLSDVHYRLGQAYAAKGDTRKAAEEFRAFLSADPAPNNELADDARARLKTLDAY